ncbi:MAG: class I mannose-6-phosphate isomerase [Clostridia bacterium]|nr:class I mannose-6-phosphate isomerase [Clostridia bacterium]
MKFYPLKLAPVTKSIIWGGNYLKEHFGFESNDENIAEAWLTTSRPDGENIIENGFFSGKTLGDYINENGIENVCGDFDAFPLLIKFIDANDRLSVQVHPDDAYAKANGLDAGKTEMWYIVDCKEGAKLVYGLKGEKAPTFSEIEKANNDGSLSEMLNYADVHKGDCFFIPAGLVHAIGDGIVIAEIQQNSNTTYRLYDYDRVGKDGKKRELHIEKASEVIKTQFPDDFVSGKVVSEKDGERCEILCKCELFSVIKYNLAQGKSAYFEEGSMKSIICLDGMGKISCGGEDYEIKKGDSYLIPKACEGFVVVSESDCFEIIVSEA